LFDPAITPIFLQLLEELSASVDNKTLRDYSHIEVDGVV
jgi:hypothetical protein